MKMKNIKKTAKTAKKPTAKGPAVLSPIRVGNCVLIRTVTTYQIGKIESLTPTEIVLSGASWCVVTKRFGAETLGSGQLHEVEAIPDGVALVSRGAIVDAYNWVHPLPRESK